jgi:tetratricopeptide (TPR) repeat protein
MTHPKFRHGLLAAALAALIAPVPALVADAAGRAPQARQAKQASQQPTDQYPEATRKAPDAKASARMSPKLQKMVDRLDDGKTDEARALAEEIIANSKANAYERAFAAQIGAQAAYDTDDTQAATGYLNQAIEANGLDNNSHFGAMLMLAQLQLQEDQYEQALQTLDRFFNESKSQKPEHLVLKGNALYRLDRFAEAAPILKQAIDASPEPRADWQQLLMGAYAEAGNVTEAAQVAQQIAAKNPDDKRAQMNLAIVYLQNDMNDEAAAVLEKLRAAGQLTEESEYRNLYATYYNMDDRQQQVIEVINEGLQKNILKPDYQTYAALAQAHYDLEQTGPAIEAFKKAAPLAKDGQTYLNLANLLWQEDRIGEAKEAARQAIAKGLKNPESAKKIIALPGN